MRNRAAQRQERIQMNKTEIKNLVSQLTLEEKAGLTSGKNAWYTKAIERLSIPSIHVSDGPHGLRTINELDQNLMSGNAETAVCFPSETGMAASFDRELLYETGKELGRQSQAAGVDVLLGPGVNMKRSPLCGRNFEYFSEDPYLASEMGIAYVKGVQSEGVGTSLKHFFANNQEYRRMDVSSELDERTMHEIYLAAFERVVKEAQPWTVMASYNKVNGVYSTANKTLLTDILRNEWGYEGAVTSDWGATHDRAGAIRAGCDLTMPGEDTDEEIVEAVRSGNLDEKDLDACVERLLELVFRAVENRRGGNCDLQKAHEASLKAAGESMVLLKNEGLLPLDPAKKTAFIGLFAKEQRYQGGGSSHINSWRVVNALEAAEKKGFPVIYAAGYNEKGETDEELLAEALRAAKKADRAVVFAGLHEEMESEGTDRVHMRLSEGHNRLIHEIVKANADTAVVLYNGSPVEMPWVNEPKAILEGYLGGEAAGEAAVSILFGEISPSAHLAETFPKKLSDNPSYLSFGGEGNRVSYSEGVFTGYRWYTSREMETLFPFGHGLTYTRFEYSDLKLDKESLKPGETLKASVTVTNTGSREGKCLVQLYVHPHHVEIIRPVRELRAFEKVSLKPDESKTVELELDEKAFAHWNVTVHAWKCEKGDYDIEICENAEKVLLSEKVTLDFPALIPVGGYSDAVPMALLAETEKGRAFLDQNIIYLVAGMVHLGFVPKEILDVAKQLPGGLTLDAMNMISQRAGRHQGAGGLSGTTALLAQPTSVLVSFLPKEKKKELSGIIEELNADLF